MNLINLIIIDHRYYKVTQIILC